eukprot:2094596-Amphidinium_carterae.1
MIPPEPTKPGQGVAVGFDSQISASNQVSCKVHNNSKGTLLDVDAGRTPEDMDGQKSDLGITGPEWAGPPCANKHDMELN